MPPTALQMEAGGGEEEGTRGESATSYVTSFSKLTTDRAFGKASQYII